MNCPGYIKGFIALTFCTVLIFQLQGKPFCTKAHPCERVGGIGLLPGNFHTMLLKHDGSIWSTGVKSDTESNNFLPVFLSGAKAAATGNYYSIVLMEDDSLWTTGKNPKGRQYIFDGSTISRHTFSYMDLIPGAKDVTAGGYHSMVMTHDGFIWATGWNKYGQLGDGTTLDRTGFVQVSANSMAVAAGDLHSIVLKEGGSVWAAGHNSNGQLGDGSNTDSHIFASVENEDGGL